MSTSRAYSVAHADSAAVAYAKWLAARDGVVIPIETPAVRAIVERDWPEGATRAMARAVRWEVGGERSERLYSTRGKFRGYGPARWECDAVLLRIEIPNWDHVPTVIEREQVAA